MGYVMQISKISAMHFFRLSYRSLLFIAALTIYLFQYISDRFKIAEIPSWIMAIIWCVFVLEMILRFFPSSLESMGCEKQFRKNYIPSGRDFKENNYVRHQKKAVWIVAFLWIALNGIFGALYLCRVFTREIMLLVSLAYSVCDMICILFFCPFHTLIMKNKCCVSCRIYNWDYAMIFTPLVFIPGFFTWSLICIALILLIKWEILVHLHPERFYEMTNQSLSCKNCEEKLCHHKKSLQRFLLIQKENYSTLLDERMKKLLEFRDTRNHK